MVNTKYGRILALATTVCVTLLGILFIVCCAHLYFTGGDQPYSRERVGEYLIILAVPSAITIALIIGGLIYSTVCGQADDEKPPRTATELLESFSKRYDLSSFGAKEKEAILKERNNRTAFKYFSYMFSAAILVIVFAYMLFIAEFTVETLNADVIAALTIALPLSAIALGIHVPRVYMAESSAARELQIMRDYIKANGAPKSAAKATASDGPDYAVIAKCVLATVAVMLVILGIFNGGMADVFAKAVKICTECIGLG